MYPYLFPALGSFLAHTKRRGVFINLNMHPAGGVEFHEKAYSAAALSMSIHPSTGQTLAFDFTNQSYAIAVFEHVLRPLDNAGLDYWWIDYQHGPFSTVPLLNPTFLTNFAWWTNPWRYGEKWSGLAANSQHPLPEFGPAHVPNSLKPGNRKHNDRPYIFGRWGGLGGHRYPVGFAGDTAVKWRVLRYETFFSPTSSNVGFMWTHGECTHLHVALCSCCENAQPAPPYKQATYQLKSQFTQTHTTQNPTFFYHTHRHWRI